MVNKSIIFSVLMLLLFTSCCDYYTTSMYGLRSKRLYKKYLNDRVDPQNINIDTNILYKSIDYIYREEDNDSIVSITDPVLLERNLYLKFYSNGTYYTYSIHDTLNYIKEKKIAPKKGNINFVIKKKNRYFFMSYSALNCGTFSKKEFKVKGDTLIISAGSNKGYRNWYYYIKHEVPKEWLDYEPDF